VTLISASLNERGVLLDNNPLAERIQKLISASLNERVLLLDNTPLAERLKETRWLSVAEARTEASSKTIVQFLIVSYMIWRLFC